MGICTPVPWRVVKTKMLVELKLWSCYIDISQKKVQVVVNTSHSFTPHTAVLQ